MNKVKIVGIRLNNPLEEELARQVTAKSRAEYKDLTKVTKELWRKYVKSN